MTNPKADEIVSEYAVTCHTCCRTMWEGNTAPADGQTILTDYAEQTPGTTCPSGVATCPNKTAAIAARELKRPATLGDLAAVKTRLSVIEAKVRP